VWPIVHTFLIPSPTYNFTTTVVATYVQAGDPVIAFSTRTLGKLKSRERKRERDSEREKRRLNAIGCTQVLEPAVALLLLHHCPASFTSATHN
jgi:hypothetical protein